MAVMTGTNRNRRRPETESAEEAERHTGVDKHKIDVAFIAAVLSPSEITRAIKA